MIKQENGNMHYKYPNKVKFELNPDNSVLTLPTSSDFHVFLLSDPNLSMCLG